MACRSGNRAILPHPGRRGIGIPRTGLPRGFSSRRLVLFFRLREGRSWSESRLLLSAVAASVLQSSQIFKSCCPELAGQQLQTLIAFPLIPTLTRSCEVIRKPKPNLSKKLTYIPNFLGEAFRRKAAVEQKEIRFTKDRESLGSLYQSSCEERRGIRAFPFYMLRKCSCRSVEIFPADCRMTFADWQSAIQQAGSLRYIIIGTAPASNPFPQNNCQKRKKSCRLISRRQLHDWRPPPEPYP